MNRLSSIWNELDQQEAELELEKKQLQDVWFQICEQHKANQSKRNKLGDMMIASKVLEFVDPHTLVRLNVGGQEFETSCGVLCRDRYSVLASLCRRTAHDQGQLHDSCLPVDAAGRSTGTIFIDRDWWIFRHILQFLRTGNLPGDEQLLQEMYDEATFYRLSLLKEAIDQRVAKPARSKLSAHDSCQCPGGRCVCHGKENRPYFSKEGYHQYDLPDPFGFTVPHTEPWASSFGH